MFAHILVGIDGSALALKAAEMAIDLALKFQSRLTLLHVTRQIAMPDHLRSYMTDEELTGEPVYAIDTATRRVVATIEEKARQHGLKSVKSVTRDGRPARTIVGYAARHEVDVIVLGSRGLTELEGMLLGSVSHKVASLAECTVILAR
jgi:nucleotide-binding universal stress UspA family protein